MPHKTIARGYGEEHPNSEIMEPKQSKVHGRKSIIEMEDGTLAIFYPDECKAVLIRWILELGHRKLQVACVQDMDHPELAKIV